MVERVFRVWCAQCAVWFRLVENEDNPIPPCPNCGDELIDITAKKFMVLGYPVAEGDGDTIGSHLFQFVPKRGGRWIRYSNWVRFNSQLTFTPTRMNLTNIETDGIAGLRVLKITNKGFRFSVISKGKGLSRISFDWEAIE